MSTIIKNTFVEYLPSETIDLYRIIRHPQQCKLRYMHYEKKETYHY